MCETSRSSSIWGWRGAASGIGQRIKHVFETEERSDVEFSVGKQYGEEQVELFRAHKFVLSVSSDVFDSMFYGGLPETTEKTIDLPDILPEAFAILLKYLYTDIVEDLSMENVLPTMYCAEKYGIPKLVDICAKYAIKNVEEDTLFTMLETAKGIGADSLVSKCLEMVDTQCSELLKSREFLELKNETVQMIFSRDTLPIDEELVYKAAERWAANACRVNGLEPTAANYRLVLGKALFLVRFPLMDDGQLVDGPGSAGFLLNEELLKIYQFKHATQKPEIPFSGNPRSSNIVFCDRQWIVQSKYDDIDFGHMTVNNTFLDEFGHVHLRYSKHGGVWKGAGVRSADSLGFGRYEFHIEGLDRLNPNVRFALYSHADREPGVCIAFSTFCPGYIMSSFDVTRTSIRCRSSLEPHPSRILPYSDKVTLAFERTAHGYHRNPDSVLFSSQGGCPDNNTRMEPHNWSYNSGPVISRKALPVYFCLFGAGDTAPCDRKEVEIVVKSFRFFPDE